METSFLDYSLPHGPECAVLSHHFMQHVNNAVILNDAQAEARFIFIFRRFGFRLLGAAESGH